MWVALFSTVMKTRYHFSIGLFFIIFAMTGSDAQEVVIANDFEEDGNEVGPAPKYVEHADSYTGIASEADFDFAVGASEESEQAYVIAGGEDDQHAWKPTMDFELLGVSGGSMRISFDVRNASTEPSTCALQVWGLKDDKEVMYQWLGFRRNAVRASNTHEHMFKEITSGPESEWHKVVWTIPLPGSESTEPSLAIDDNNYVKFEEVDTQQVESVVRLRFFLQGDRGPDVRYAIDNFKVEHLK